MKRIIVDGAFGQIGVELVRKLRKEYGSSNVLASSIRDKGAEQFGEGPFELGNSSHKILYLILFSL